MVKAGQKCTTKLFESAFKSLISLKSFLLVFTNRELKEGKPKEKDKIKIEKNYTLMSFFHQIYESIYDKKKGKCSSN